MLNYPDTILGMTVSLKLTKGFKRLHQLNGEFLPFRKLLQHLCNFIVSTANKAMAIDGLNHVSHIDDLNLVDDAALTDPLKNKNK